MIKSRKIIYIAFTGLLTSMAMTACYWQTSRYLDSKKRWKTISKQLSQQNPRNIAQLSQHERLNLYAFKYIELQGQLSTQKAIVTRARGMRTGYLVLRKITYTDKDKQKRDMIALEGWCPENYQLKEDTLLNQVFIQPTTNDKTAKADKKITAHKNKSKNVNKEVQFRGILRKKQKVDYLHTKLKQGDLQKYKMNTWIDLTKYLKLFKIEQDDLNSNFYFEILKPMNAQNDPQESKEGQAAKTEQQYPYQYSVDNFELPYLTPQKHQGYASFWFCTSLVGWFAILKVLRMK